MSEADQLFQQAYACQCGGDLLAAARFYTELLSRQPRHAVACNNLGNVVLGLGHAVEAEACFRQALDLRQDYGEARFNLGRLEHLCGRYDEALRDYTEAMALLPDQPQPAYNRALLLNELGCLDEAVLAYRNLLSRVPDHAHAWNNLGKALRERGEVHEAIGAFERALRIAPADAEIASNRLFALLHADAPDPENWLNAQAEFRRLWTSERLLTPGHDRDPWRPLKVGLVSGDLGNHPVGRFLEPLADHLDAGECQLYAFPTFDRADSIANHLRSRCQAWHSLAGLDDLAAARLIAGKQIDVLLDLSGHTAGNRLGVFSLHPAPVQITWLGFLGSTGMAAMDWRLTDAICDPSGVAEAWHYEKMLRMAGCQWCYRPPSVAGSLPISQPGGAPVLGSFNSVGKLSNTILDLWAGILVSLPAATLRVFACPAGESRRRILARLAGSHIDAGRVAFVDRCSTAEYFEHFHQVHIALDSYPYTGGTTTCDALWMGVPVVSLAGNHSVSRSGASLLAAVGLADWVARSPDEYASIVRKWVGNPDDLSKLKGGLHARMVQSSLMDEADFARRWLGAIRSAWQEGCRR